MAVSLCSFYRIFRALPLLTVCSVCAALSENLYIIPGGAGRGRSVFASLFDFKPLLLALLLMGNMEGRCIDALGQLLRLGIV